MTKIVKKEVAIVDFTTFSIAQLPELQGKKEEIKSVIEANPVIEVIDNTTYESAKKSRTAVKTLRTSLEKEKKDVNDRIKKNVLDVVANEYNSLIESVKTDENARQETVTAWETKKEEERLEKARLEQERIDRIKNSIELFKKNWMYNVSVMIFENIESFNDMFSLESKNFDRSVLAEFEVLFDDALSVIRQLADSKISTLTEQENIRLEQIRLAEERKKQEEEAKKIAESQRIEREKFEAEQRDIAEKQRIAQEKFQKEKAEFEERQAEAKFQERKKLLVDFGMVDDGKERLVFGDYEFRYFQIREFDEPNWNESIEFIGQKICEFNNPKSDEIAQEEYHEQDTHEEATKGLSTRLKANTQPTETQGLELRETWENIFESYQKQNSDSSFESKEALIQWLSENYNIPTRKN